MKFNYQIYLSFLFLGVVLTLFAFIRFLNSHVLFLIFSLIIILFLVLVISLFRRIKYLNKNELYFFYLFTIIWSLHFLQVLVPETGFDALWYHLPVVNKIIQNQGLVFLPDLYQSVNPLFADLYFASGFSVLGLLGAKIVAYIFGLMFVLSSYSLSKLFLSRRFSIIVAIIVSTFQVVAWQSSSFYVDVSKGFFEIAGLLFLITFIKNNANINNVESNKNLNKYRKISLLFFSASLATKLFSILLVPVFIYIYKLKKFFSKKILVNMIFLFGIPLFYYYFAYIYTGHPFYSLVVHTQKINEIGGQQDLFTFIFYKLMSLPKSLISFIFARDYVAPIIIIFFIPIFLKFKKILKSEKLKALFIYGFGQWIIWWFVPPLSTRYAISGFVALLILGLTIFLQHNSRYKQKLAFILFVYTIVLMVPRVVVAKRSLKYILTPQTTKQYLEQFDDGSIDEKINDWYHL